MKYLESGKRLDRKKAYIDLGIMNVTARITELRNEGIPIVTEMKTVKNRWNEKCRVADWYLENDS
tara:strand:+ start:1513 stop:1707 length:195 start_codon:yes stop_codon:yes gene_type:complete